VRPVSPDFAASESRLCRGRRRRLVLALLPHTLATSASNMGGASTRSQLLPEPALTCARCIASLSPHPPARLHSTSRRTSPSRTRRRTAFHARQPGSAAPWRADASPRLRRLPGHQRQSVGRDRARHGLPSRRQRALLQGASSSPPSGLRAPRQPLADPELACSLAERGRGVRRRPQVQGRHA